MRYVDFEYIISPERMSRYLLACGGDTKKAMTLYRYNLRVSQEMFTVISCFEVALRNAIDRELKPLLGADWLRDSVKKNGVFDKSNTQETYSTIKKEYLALRKNNDYSHAKLLSVLNFGIWKHMYARPQFNATHKCLLAVFPNKPKSTMGNQINQSFIYKDLDNINKLRNRIAHHEPICFDKPKNMVDTTYVRDKYIQIIRLYNWMNIDSKSLLYGMDHVQQICDQIDSL